MTKPVTRDRILSTHAKIDAFSELLTSADQHIVMTAAKHGLKTHLGVETPIESDKVRLEMTVNDVMTPAQGDIVIDRFFRNVKRIHSKRDKVYAIQHAHNISGLEMGEDSLGDGVITRWVEADIHLSITDADLDLLRGDRLNLLQFWIDHVTLNNLEVYKDVDGEWMESTIDYIQVMSRDYDWVHFWEHKSYLKPDYSQPVRHSSDPDRVCGHVLKTSSTPQDGFEKQHEIHLVLGDGKFLDDPERSMWFCATNEVTPFR